MEVLKLGRKESEKREKGDQREDGKGYGGGPGPEKREGWVHWQCIFDETLKKARQEPAETRGGKRD